MSEKSSVSKLDINTQEFVREFILHRLLGDEHELKYKEMKILKCVGDSFLCFMKELYAIKLKDLDETKIDDDEKKFDIIVTSTFNGDIYWGKIVSFLVYVSILAVKTFNKNFILWTTIFFDTGNMKKWIDEHGGWNGLIEYFNCSMSRCKF